MYKWISDFSAIQILREINCSDFEKVQNYHFDYFKDYEFWYCNNLADFQDWNIHKFKIHNF